MFSVNKITQLKAHVSGKIKLNLKKIRYYNIYKKTLSSEVSNLLIGELIEGGQPLMVSRFGSNELSCIIQYLDRTPYSEPILYSMSTNAGFFPTSKENLDRFSLLFLESVKLVDVLGVWLRPGEEKLIQHFCPKSNLVKLSSLEPYYHQNPWSQKLKGKKVLVVHPFSESIMENYKNHRKLLFADNNILPEFKLTVIKAVQSLASNNTEFNSWFEAYEWMCKKINEQDFDIAILGCGAYGLPLAAHIKSIGKQAIHLGGATQILFGIKGKRWDENPFFQSLYNQYWIRPKESEMPTDYQKIESGCYW